MNMNVAALLYLLAGVLFILALRGLSSPESSRRGNLYGMVGMAIAIVTTLFVSGAADGLTWTMIVVGVALGGGIGAVTARRIPMTAMPQLVAAFHSLVGMAAVLVAAAALYAPEAFGIGAVGAIKGASLVEMSIGVAIGAVTFSGSVVAFTKLQGLVSGSPVTFSGQHPLNAVLGIVLIGLVAWFCSSESHTAFWLLTLLTLVWGFFVIADSAQFSAMITEVAPTHAVGTALTVQTSLGFLLTMLTIQLVPHIAEAGSWRWAFAVLTLGPAFGIWSIAKLGRGGARSS